MAFCLAIGLAAASPTRSAATRDAQINAWVRIAPDGTVTILTAGAEMGKGSMTSLPLILAEEMDADWSKVKIEWAPADPAVYGYTSSNAQAMAIVGSRAVHALLQRPAHRRRAGAQGADRQCRREMGRRRRHR